MTVNELLALLNTIPAADRNMPVFVEGDFNWFDAQAVVGACPIVDSDDERGHVYSLMISGGVYRG